MPVIIFYYLFIPILNCYAISRSFISLSRNDMIQVYGKQNGLMIDTRNT